MVASINRTLYTGVTGDIELRVRQHRDGVNDGFTSAYKCDRLVWVEYFDDIRDAIAREKQIKRWRRSKKVELIEATNAAWEDLAASWFDD